MTFPNAPWIEETERTGYCSSGWWNNPPKDDDPFDWVCPDDLEDDDGDEWDS